jgi:hypothetical protein
MTYALEANGRDLEATEEQAAMPAYVASRPPSRCFVRG